MWGIPIENYSISFMASWWSLFSAKIMWNHSTVNEKEKIMWNHFTVVIDSKFCQKETKNYVKSKQFVFLYWSNLVWQKISVKSQHSFWNKICPKTKNCVKPMQCNDIQIDLAEYFCQITTVWKCWDFSVIQILCEINFVGFRSSKKMSFLPFFWALNFFIWVIFSLQKVQDFKEIKIQCL